jgi:hypothetical protein
MANRKARPEDDFEILGVKNQERLPPQTRQKPSKYDEVVRLATNLNPGEVLEIAIDPKTDPVEARNRISATVRRLAVPETEHKLKIRLTTRGSIGIYCYARERFRGEERSPGPASKRRPSKKHPWD